MKLLATEPTSHYVILLIFSFFQFKFDLLSVTLEHDHLFVSSISKDVPHDGNTTMHASCLENINKPLEKCDIQQGVCTKVRPSPQRSRKWKSRKLGNN